MELDTFQRKSPVPNPHHHQAATRPGAGRGHLETVGQLEGGQRVIANGPESLWQTGENPPTVVHDQCCLAVGWDMPVDCAAVRRDESLHAQTDTEHGAGARAQDLSSYGEVGGFIGAARTGREHDVREGEDLGGLDLVMLDDGGK